MRGDPDQNDEPAENGCDGEKQQSSPEGVQDGHLHLLTEADGWKALSDGTRALSIRIARSLNRVLKRTGKVIADRYHARALSTPLEVRNAIVYVLQNGRKHLAQRGVEVRKEWLDRFSSAAFFRGWDARMTKAADALRACGRVTATSRPSSR